MSSWDNDREATARTIQGWVQSVDLLTDAMERKWGIGRLRMLVADDMRERFDRQWRKWQQAYGAQDFDQVRAHSEAMRRAWAALDTAAEAAGHAPLKPEVWEARMPDGIVLAIVRTTAEANALGPDTTERTVWTLDSIARVIAAWEGRNWVDAVREHFPGAKVDRLRLTPRGSEAEAFADDPIPFGHDWCDTNARTPLAGVRTAVDSFA